MNDIVLIQTVDGHNEILAVIFFFALVATGIAVLVRYAVVHGRRRDVFSVFAMKAIAFFLAIGAASAALHAYAHDHRDTPLDPLSQAGYVPALWTDEQRTSPWDGLSSDDAASTSVLMLFTVRPGEQASSRCYLRATDHAENHPVFSLRWTTMITDHLACER